MLVYNPDQVSRDQLPSSLLDLAQPEWDGRIGFSPTETDFQPLVSTVIAEDGRDAAKQWLEGLKANGTTYDSNEAIIDGGQRRRARRRPDRALLLVPAP